MNDTHIIIFLYYHKTFSIIVDLYHPYNLWRIDIDFVHYGFVHFELYFTYNLS